MSRVRFHHMRQQPVTGLNQMFRVYRPFPGPGIGIVLFRHEFSITVGPEEHP